MRWFFVGNGAAIVVELTGHKAVCLLNSIIFTTLFKKAQF
jgi:hypothetical protein